MRRVVIALCAEAACFAMLVFWLDLGRSVRIAGWSALGVFAGVLAVGFPIMSYCCRHRLWEPWRAVLLGAAYGGLCALPFNGGTYSFGFLLLVLVLAGMMFGALFWVAALWRNEDITCPKSFCLPCGTAYRVARHALRRR